MKRERRIGQRRATIGGGNMPKKMVSDVNLTIRSCFCRKGIQTC
jgi:hypothetical protein